MNLHQAINEGNTAEAMKLINEGADIEAIGTYGETPLILAACRNNREIVIALLNNGANIHALDQYGRTPLHHAATDAGTEVINLLLERGANIEVSNWFGQTTLYEAVLLNNHEVIETLINHGANTEAISNNGKTPIMCAIEYKSFECIKNLTKGATKELIELSPQNNRLSQHLKEQYIIAKSESTKRSGFIESIKNFINDITKTMEQKRIETSMRNSAKALFGMETTLKAKALLKIKIGALRSGVKDPYINTLKFLYYFTRFNLTAENINHIIGYVGLYDAKVDLNDILSDLSPKLSRDIQNTQINTLVLNQASKASRDTPVTCCCTISQ